MRGVQPDEAIDSPELAKTPAMKVKERSLSSTRRSALEQCPCCDSPAGSHKPAMTPRGTSKISK